MKMNRNKAIAMLVMAVLLCLLFTGCSRDNGANSGNATYLGPKKTYGDTISASLTNEVYPSGVTLNWSERKQSSEITLTGLQTISFVLDGDETKSTLFRDLSLSSIELVFTGQTSGKSQSLSNSFLGNVTNIATDGDYFKLDGNSFKFYPHYFQVGEVVTVHATFTYKGDGLANQLLDNETEEGYFCFTVGEDTGEKFSGLLDNIGDGLNNAFGNGGNSDGSDEDSTVSETAYTPVTFTVSGVDGSFTVHRLQTDSEKNAIKLETTTPTITFLSREASLGKNITKVYVIPVGMEDEMQKIPWTNAGTYLADNCHIFEKLDLSAYSGKTVTIRVEFLDGAEINPFKDHTFGFVTFIVP